jgi:acyl dehydratase
MSMLSLEAWRALAGTGTWQSPWFTIDQPRINAFADATEDHQFIHVDPAAAANTAFGGTIAHGYLVLGMLSAMVFAAVPALDGISATLNYGFDRIRFLAPVPAGTRIRGHFTLNRIEDRPGQLRSFFAVHVEMEGKARHALAADWITVALL